MSGSFAPVLLLFALHGRCIRVLHFNPDHPQAFWPLIVKSLQALQVLPDHTLDEIITGAAVVIQKAICKSAPDQNTHRINRDSPDESQTGINVRVFPALLQDRREMLTATSTSGNPN